MPAVHADLHVLEYNPLNNRLYAGNDGGIYYSSNQGSSWPEITDGLPISQVYRIGQSKTDINKVINGYQDNGTSTYLNGNWQTTNGGDGMECAFDHENSSYSYSTLYYGDIYRHFNNSGSHQVAGEGAHGMNESGGWVTPFCLHEGDPTIMFGGYKNIWRAEGVTSNNFTWKKITPTGGGDIDVVEHSPANYDLFYYARNAQLYRSDNVMAEDPEWVTLTTNLPGSGDVFDVETHPYDENIVYITQGQKVYVSDNKGFNWTDISGSLPAINMNTLAFYLNSIDGIYVGSDAGVYYRDASMDDWEMFSNGLPVDASVNELEIYHNPDDPSEDVIRAGTYGRGLWSSPMWQDQPVAAFESDETEIPVGCPVNFFDLSTGIPTSWDWTFEGANPPTSTAKNPEGIVYVSEGSFAVSLTVSNSEGADTESISGYITVSGTALPNVYFMASDSITCAGEAIQFTDMSSNCPTGWQWDFDPNDVTFVNGTSATSQNPEVTFNGSGAYTVTLTVTNNAGSNNLVKENYINIGGIGIPFSDDFESGNLDSKSWTVQNPDFGITWDVAGVSGNGESTSAARMNFYDYVVPPGPRDRLISPVLSLEGFDDVYLMFDHAYAKRHTTITDSLIVKVTSDCGNTWTRIYEGGEDNTGVFATHELMEDPFIPSEPEDWCGNGWGADCIVLDLSEWAGQDNFRVMFETYNYFGNNLYIDNVVVGPLVSIGDAAYDKGILVFPNPSTDVVNIVIPEHLGESTVQVLDIQGKVVEAFHTLSGETLKTTPSKYQKGVYFIRINSIEGLFTKKLILK